MRARFLVVLIIAPLLVLSCSNTPETTSRVEANPDFYLPQSMTTDPGPHARLFENLPKAHDELCDLIKKQLIHPVDIGPYRDVLPEERHFEDTLYLTVEAMLSDLMKYDASGLVPDRAPANRLVVACLHHSLLFASILRERGIPVRIRFGFAPYIGRMFGADISISHIVCEVWNEDESRWVYVDPDRQMVDFPGDEFITGAEAWLLLGQDNLDVSEFRSAFFVKEQAILDMLRLDLRYALREEIMYWGEDETPEVPELEDLTLQDLRTLDRIAELLKHAGSHTGELNRLGDSVMFLR